MDNQHSKRKNKFPNPQISDLSRRGRKRKRFRNSESDQQRGSNSGQTSVPENLERSRLLEKLFATSSIAPWINREEWLDFYNLIKPPLEDPENPELLTSLDLQLLGNIVDSCWIRAWNSSLEPMHVTVILLQALQALNEGANMSVLSGSMAVIRFVKLVGEDPRERERSGDRPSIMLACRQAGVPEWVVRIRHDAAHNEMQDPKLLTEAVCFALKWLKENYWDIEVKRIEQENYMIKLNTDEVDEPNEDETADVIKSELSEIFELIQDFGMFRSYQRISQSDIRVLDRRIQHAHFYMDNYPNLFADVLSSSLCRKTQFKATDGENLSASLELPVLPIEELNKFRPVVDEFLRRPLGINFLLKSLIHNLISNCDEELVVCGWIRYILEAIPRNRISSVRIWNAFDWNLLVEKVTAKPGTFTETILKRLTYWISTKKQHEFLKDSRRLVSAWSSQRNTTASSHVQTLAQLIKETGFVESVSKKAHAEESVESHWSLANEDCWNGLPIGILPNDIDGAKLYPQLLLQF